jgi:DNA processing protein
VVLVPEGEVVSADQVAVERVEALAETVANIELQNWNIFLAAEFPYNKGRMILESLDPFHSSSWHSLLLNHPDVTDAEKRRIQNAIYNPSTGILCEEEYPPTIGNATFSPFALSFFGDTQCLRSPCISIVGTRSASTYGKVCARMFAEEFARHGVTVISGGAIGIDGAAHEGVLSVGGKTVAVLANGVDHVYPSAHAGLFERIKTNGCLVSQFATGTKPADYKFILRNQLIAALSHAVVVIEAPQKSGAIRTAGYAGEIGREVFVVPGPIDSVRFHGSHALIRDGASLVDHPHQVLESIGVSLKESKIQPELEGMSGKIISVLDSSAKSVEKIVELTGLGTSDVLSELTILEMDGYVLKDSGGFAKKL